MLDNGDECHMTGLVRRTDKDTVTMSPCDRMQSGHTSVHACPPLGTTASQWWAAVMPMPPRGQK